MPTTVDFIDCGQGNMTLMKLANGKVFLYDCSVTGDNEKTVLDYVESRIGKGTKIDVFICSHRDADHMRGVKKVHARFPIQHIWDSGATGTSPDCTEYKEYMELRRKVGYTEVKRMTMYDYGNTRLRVMNAKNDKLADNANAQSIVIKVVHRDAIKKVSYDSIMLTGDTDAKTWQDIRSEYTDADLSCSLLLASHHGSISYFDDPDAEDGRYTSHLEAKSPAMTFISVGKDNQHGHPDAEAVKLYNKHSTGSSKGNKVYRTDENGNIQVTLKDGGGWSVNKDK